MLGACHAWRDMNGSFYFALVAGVVAAFNPCGFAMLPAYIGYFVGANTGGQAGAEVVPGALPRLARAIVVGAAVTAGFMVVFGTLGLLIHEAKARITEYLPKATIVVGVLMIALGIAMLVGYELKMALPKIGKATKGNNAWSMFVYGISYAIVSLSCTITPFLAATATTFEDSNVISGLAVYLTYAAGMGTVMLMVSLASALAQHAVIRGMRRVLPYVNRVSGAMLAAVGAYLIWYGYVSDRLLNSTDRVRLGPVAWVERWSGQISSWVDGLDRTVVILAVTLTIAGAMTILLWNRAARVDKLEKKRETA